MHLQPPTSLASPSIHDEHMQIRVDARFGYRSHHPGNINVGVGSAITGGGVAGPGVALGPGVGVGAARDPHTLGSLLNHPHPSPETQAQTMSRSASPRSTSGAGANHASISPTISSADPRYYTHRSPTITSTSAPAASTMQTRTPGGSK
ncbi:hypothetical protein K439DRAFT_1640990 [Ramaria rubella]|nr:hypothetical protein K439DRAFT_1640990 [Ramaria rubella]